MLKALLVDDEAPARDELKYLLSGYDSIEVAGEADSGPAAISLAAQLKPDVIFLDVQMRGMTGLETAVVLRAILPDALIIFATAYDEYAVKAFEVGAVDYVLKPFEGARVVSAIERLRKYLPDEWRAAASRIDETLTKSKINVHKLPVNKQGKIMLIAYDDVVYAYAQAGGVSVVTVHGTFCYDGTLTELQERVKMTSLFRVHKSYIVNMDKVQEVVPWFKGTYWLKVGSAPGVEIPVSKGKIKEIKDILGLK